MSVVHLQNVEILNPNAEFKAPYIFKVTFESIAPLEDDLEWRLIYVGSAQSKDYDQELDNCLVGPVPLGVNSFEFEAAAPDSSKIPAEDLLGVTVILLTGSYNDQEFIRVGYYVHNDYEDPELRETPPEQVDLTKVRREVLVEKPRVTRFNIKWDTEPTAAFEEAANNAAASAFAPTADPVENLHEDAIAARTQEPAADADAAPTTDAPQEQQASSSTTAGEEPTKEP